MFPKLVYGLKVSVCTISKQQSSSLISLKDLDASKYVILPRTTNQVEGLAKYANKFLNGSLGVGPSKIVSERTDLFHVDSIFCGLTALSLKTNAPMILRNEALDLEYTSKNGAQLLGSNIRVKPEKAVLANVSAVRELDCNGTLFGYDPLLDDSFKAGEFGHNDFYSSIIAASQIIGYDGKYTLNAMILQDEIRGRLAQVFSLKKYAVDSSLYGAISTAIVYGIMIGANVKQIESAVGMIVSHYIPFRATRSGNILSDSKGASAAISSEMAIISVHRAMKGFQGPMDIFRNENTIFKPKSDNESAFDLVLSHSGDNFCVMKMHFKIGMYCHLAAGAIEALFDILQNNQFILSSMDNITQSF